MERSMMYDEIFHKGRLEKLEKLKSLGINPYPYKYSATTMIKEIRDKETDFLSKRVSLAGRIVSIRKHGKTMFMDLRDITGNIQIYLKKDTLEPIKYGDSDLWHVLQFLEVGDILGVHGEVFQTKRGELTVWVKEYQILSKALHPIPFGKQKGEEKWYSVSDPEVKYRERYVYWNVYSEEREYIIKRGQIIQFIREYMLSKGFLEVQTPSIEMVYGGAEARPFETSIWALGGQRAFLRISPELYLKRYLVAGFPKVFTICQNFRNEGIDKSHNPEFTMMEWYEAYTDYFFQMKRFEDLVWHIVSKATGKSTINYQGVELDFTPPWKRWRMVDAIRELTGFDVEKSTPEEIKEFMERNGISYEGEYRRGLAICAIFDALCEDKIIQPTFIFDHPVEGSPLTKQRRDNPDFVERFEPFVVGMELGNAYSELTDPLEQYERFKEQRRVYEDAEVHHHPMDWDFIKAIACGMPPTGGVGLGIDRLIMIINGVPSIRDIIPFPFIKPRDHSLK